METISVSELRSNLMSVLKRIESGASISITSHGREVAHLIPPEARREHARARLGELGKTANIGDLLSPVEEQWDAEQ